MSVTHLHFSPALRAFEPLHVPDGAPAEHLAFEYDLAVDLAPALVVDVGAGSAGSFLAYCQAVRDTGDRATCFAVDPWSDDAERPEDDPGHSLTVNHLLRTYHRGIAYPVKLGAAEALCHFADGSVELLRLDAIRLGLPLADLARQWLPKVAPAGVLVCPGLCGPDAGALSGAWADLARAHDAFVFDRPAGLGVLRRRGAPRPADGSLLALLFSADPGDRAGIAAYYAHAAEHLALRRWVRPHRFNLGKRKPASG